jgi:hypothetical protein
LVRGSLQKNVRSSTVAVLTGYVYFRDSLSVLLKDHVESAEDFKWQMQFKFSFKDLDKISVRHTYDE